MSPVKNTTSVRSWVRSPRIFSMSLKKENSTILLRGFASRISSINSTVASSLGVALSGANRPVPARTAAYWEPDRPLVIRPK